jgi:hypothetical protein
MENKSAKSEGKGTLERESFHVQVLRRAVRLPDMQDNVLRTIDFAHGPFYKMQ